MRPKRDECLNTRRLFFHVPIIILAAVIGTASWIRLGGRPRQEVWNESLLEGLNVYGEIPDFSLLERNGRQVGLSELRGKVWIATFIYTSCKDTCPFQSAEMAGLQKDFMDRCTCG